MVDPNLDPDFDSLPVILEAGNENIARGSQAIFTDGLSACFGKVEVEVLKCKFLDKGDKRKFVSFAE